MLEWLNCSGVYTMDYCIVNSIVTTLKENANLDHNNSTSQGNATSKFRNDNACILAIKMPPGRLNF